MKTLFYALLFFTITIHCVGQSADSIKTINGAKYIQHKVVKGEYWYNLARKFNIPYPQLRNANAIMTKDLKNGDIIYVPYEINKKEENDSSTIPKLSVVDSVKKEQTIIVKTATTATVKISEKLPTKTISEKGIATWIDDEDINQKKYFALHRTASIGTLIKVTNVMNEKSVFVKVVGTLPDTGDNANLIIKISNIAAKKLEVLDARFRVELSYGVME